MKHLNNIDLNKNELQNASMHKLASAPSSPVKGQTYFNTTDNKAYVYNGTNWVEMTSQGKQYTFQNGVEEVSDGVVEAKLNATQGNVTLTKNGGLKANVAEASTSAKGIIEIATDAEASAGTSEVLAVNPKQLATKVPNTRTVNGKSLSNDIELNASDVGALADTTKYGASLTLSIDSSTYVVTVTLKDQDGNTLGTAQTIDLPLESVVVSGSYDATTKKVILTLQDGSTIDFSVADLVSGLQTEITSTNKLSADLVEDGTTNKVFTATEKTKLAGMQAGAEVNVQADWNVTDSSSDAYIKNKPSIPTDTNQKIKVGSTTFGDDDEVELVAGTNITITPNASAGTIVINANANTRKYSADNPALTVSGGLATWTVTHNLATKDVVVGLEEVSTGEVVIADIVKTSVNVVTIKIVSSSNITAGTYRVTVIG